MRVRRSVPTCGVAVVSLLALAMAPPVAGARGAEFTGAERPIVEARLLAPVPGTEGAWLVQVEEVLNGSLPGSVAAVRGLPGGLVPAGEAGERLRLVLSPAEDGTYRVLSAHLSPPVDPALENPLPPPLALAPDGIAREPREGSVRAKTAPAPSLEEQVVELVNEERWDAGQLPPLKQVPELHSATGDHSSAMAVRDFFAHCDLDTGKSPWTRMVDAGYLWSWAGENIAAGSSTAAGVMSQWVNSPGHYANIVSTSFREIGVGHSYQSGDQGNVRRDLNGDCDSNDVVSGFPETGWGPYFHYWTQAFGRRNTVYPVVIEREAHSTTGTSVDLYVYGTGWAEEMRFSNDGFTWSAWETYDPNRTWTLSGGAGTKTVYAQIKNGATVRQASDTIYLDTPCVASPQNRDVPDQTVTTEATFAACDTVSAVSGFTVGDGGDVTFQAGNRVVLGNGFAVLDGGSFRAILLPPP